MPPLFLSPFCRSGAAGRAGFSPGSPAGPSAAGPGREQLPWLAGKGEAPVRGATGRRRPPAFPRFVGGFFPPPFPPPLFPALAFRVGSLVRSEKCLQRRGVPQVELVRAFSPLLLWLAFLLCGRIQGASVPLPRFLFPSLPASSSLRGEKPGLFPVSRPARALTAPAVRRCCVPLRSPSSPLPSRPLPPPGAAPASGGRSRTWAPRGAPPAPRRRLPPSPATPSPAALSPAPIHLLLCCSLPLSPFSELLSPRPLRG